MKYIQVKCPDGLCGKNFEILDEDGNPIKVPIASVTWWIDAKEDRAAKCSLEFTPVVASDLKGKLDLMDHMKKGFKVMDKEMQKEFVDWVFWVLKFQTSRTFDEENRLR